MPAAQVIPEPTTEIAHYETDQADMGRQAYDVAGQLDALVTEMGALKWWVQGYSSEYLTEVARCLHSTSMGLAISSGDTSPVGKAWPQNRYDARDNRAGRPHDVIEVAVQVPDNGAVGEMSGHALYVSRRLYALMERMVTLSWGVDGHTRAELRDIANHLHSTSMRAAIASGSRARVREATGLSLLAQEIDFGPGEPRAAPAEDGPAAGEGFAAGEVAQWVMDAELSDPWHLTLPGMVDDLVILRADRDRLQSELDQLRAATPKEV